MATLFPTLERENTQEKFEQESSLKAYGKLSGRDESAALTEDEKAMRFNSQISDNYQKLINPEYKREEEVVAESAAEAPVFEPVFEHQRVTEDLFRADSVYNAPKRSFAEIPAASYAEPVYAPETYAEPEQNAYAPEQQAFVAEADLMPTATTIQYQNNLYKEEQQERVENKKSYSMTAKGKVLMLVYSLAVMVILALIIINTSVLKTLDSDAAAKREALNAAMTEYAQVQEKIDELTSADSIIQRAEDEFGMVMGD